MYGVDRLTYTQVANSFCQSLGIKQKVITDEKFVKILNVCWHAGISMNFMGSAYGDGEDIEYAREQVYKKFVLFNIYDYYIWHIDGLKYQLREIFKDEKVEVVNEK